MENNPVLQQIRSEDMSENINEISLALSQAQGEMGGAKKNEKGYGYSYSNLAEVIASSRPTLAKFGLAVTQLVGSTEESVSVTTILTHKSGQFFKSIASIPLVEMKSCNIAQRAGASLSYLRRYAYQSIIGQPSEDNDASSEGFKGKKAITDVKKKPENKPTEEKKTRFKSSGSL